MNQIVQAASTVREFGEKMNKTYAVNKDARNGFKRILKDIANDAELSWTETNDDINSYFVVECSENVITLIDKFSAQLSTVNLLIRAKSKLVDELEEITHSLNGKMSKSIKKGYFIITLDRSHKNTFHNIVEQRGLKINISQSLI